MLLCGWLSSTPLTAAAEVAVHDGTGARVALHHPAQRIISLAPHLTEQLFAAGAGAQVIGVVEYSNYPPTAQNLARIGSYTAPDLERIAALQPDLVVGWPSGNGPQVLARVERLGMAVYRDEPRHIDAIPDTLEKFGVLAGSDSTARMAAAQWRERLQQLRTRYAGAPVLTVFYQVWHRPLMTVNGQHLISDALTLCGGRNVFADLPALAPQVSLEAVLAADPQVIVASGMAEERPEWLDDWKRWPQLVAVQRKDLYFIPPDLLQRAGPRFIDGAERLCAALAQARAKP